jgi:chaperonin GroES
MKITPIRDHIVAKRVEEQDEKKVGSIIIPDAAKEKPITAEVVAVGSGRVLDDGKQIPLEVKAGDKIIIGKYSGSEVKLDDIEYVVLREDDVLGIVE